jgi:predicted AAA+ superfamily ATPase
MSNYVRWQKLRLEDALASRRVVMLTGARQCGKTTLARTLVSDSASYLTLDDQAMRQAAESDPHLFVNHALDKDTLIIDEIQKVPDLLPAIKKVVDQNNRSGQFLITGSANILNLPTVQESLAGRIGKVRLRPLSQGEIIKAKPLFLDHAFEQNFKRGKKRHNRSDLIEAIFSGGFPEPMRLEGKARKNWHIDYIDALIEHDLNDVTNIRHVDVMKDLVRVLAAWSSKFMDISAIGTSLSADRRTLANYISALQAFYIVESVPAWHKTDYDRVGKMRKLFMADTGMMAALLNWKTPDFADDSDKIGKAFETFAYNELAAQIDAAEESYHLYQYRDHDKREIDFLIERDDQHRLAIEIKSGISIKRTDFKHIEWFRDNLSKGTSVIGVILYAGDDILPFGKNLWAVPFDCMWCE